jgi:SET domain-containing protein
MSLHSQAIYVAASDIGGRGVFAGKKIYAGDVIEVCPVLPMKKGEMEILDTTTLYDYYFLWEDEEQQIKSCAIALGFGSLYNHFAPSNADYIMDFDNLTIDIMAVRDIEAGEEITINYHGEPGDTSPTWFMLDDKKR